MDKVSSTSALWNSLPLEEVVGFLVLVSILNWAYKLHKICQRYFTSSPSTHTGDRMKKNATNEAREAQERIWRQEMEMFNMGLFPSPGSYKLKDCACFDEPSTVCEVKEPSLQEANEAFSVFDENRDGFIDAMELQTVLCKLGFEGGAGLDACQQMMETFDENNDGKIDFNEFVGFMESCSC